MLFDRSTSRAFREEHLMKTTLSSSRTRPERRNVAERDALLRGIWMAFVDMPTLSLTDAQARRLFNLRADVCERILDGLIDAEALSCGSDGRYRLRERTWQSLAS
jgi:hypothetical protein